MDRNIFFCGVLLDYKESLSARRAWIEIRCPCRSGRVLVVALRKESVDRNSFAGVDFAEDWLVALRKESVDRNILINTMTYI